MKAEEQHHGHDGPTARSSVRRARPVRHHGRPGQEEAVPRRVPHGQGRHARARRSGRRRVVVGLERRAAARAGPRVDRIVVRVPSRSTRRVQLVGQPADATCRGDYRDPATFDNLGLQLQGREHPLFYLAIPPSLFEDVVQGLDTRRAQQGRAGRRREAVRSRPGSRRRSSTRCCTRRSPSRRCSASTTSSARNRSRTCSCSASPTRCSSRSGTATSSTRSRSRWPRRSTCKVAASSTTPSGALRDVVQNHLLEIVALLAMEPPSNSTATALHDEKVKVFRQVESFRPDQVSRGQYRGYVDEAGVQPGSDTETFLAAAVRDRVVAVGRGAVADPRRQVDAGHRDRGGRRVQGAAAAVVLERRQPAARAQLRPLPPRVRRRHHAPPPGEGAGRRSWRPGP